MNMSVSQAAKEWSVSRTTIYQKISNGELSRGADKKIDTSEMIRVFGEPNTNEQKNVQNEHATNIVQKTQVDTGYEQRVFSDAQHQLEIEQLKNEYLCEQVASQKLIIEDYQRQINQLNKSLAQATASINEFAQTRLLELKKDRNTERPQPEDNTTPYFKPKVKEAVIEDNHTRPKSSTRSKIKSIVGILVGID